MIGCLNITGNCIIPPVELDHIQAFNPEPFQGPVDDGLCVGLCQSGEIIQIWNIFCVNLDVGQRAGHKGGSVFADEFSDKLFDSSIDIGTVKCCKTFLNSYWMLIELQD